MNILQEVKLFLITNDFTNEVEKDIKAIEDGQINNLDNIKTAYFDLLYTISKNAEFESLFSNPSSAANAIVQRVTGEAASYLSSITLQVQDPNNPSQYVDLHQGSASINAYGRWRMVNFGTPQFPQWEKIYDDTVEVSQTYVPNLLGLINNTYGNDNFVSNVASWGDGDLSNHVNTDWAKSGQLTKFQTNAMWGDEGVGEGTLSQWTAYIHCSSGDHSALDNELQNI